MPVRPCKTPDMYYTLMLSQSPRPALTCVSSPRAFPDAAPTIQALGDKATLTSLPEAFTHSSRRCDADGRPFERVSELFHNLSAVRPGVDEEQGGQDDGGDAQLLAYCPSMVGRGSV